MSSGGRSVSGGHDLTWPARLEVAFGVASVVVGVLCMLAPRTPLFDAYNATISAAFFGGAPMPEPALRLSHWLLATCGAGIVGWGLAWAYIAHVPFRRGERWAHRCLAVSLVAWAALDVAAAAWFGVTGELAFVTAAFVAAGIPLVATWRDVG